MKFNEAILIAITSNDILKKSDAVIWLEGDGYSRFKEVFRIFQAGWARNIVVSGGINNLSSFTIPANLLVKKLLKAGVSKNRIIVENNSQNTYEQAVEIMKIVKKKKWKKIILVASHFHQARAFLTFLQAMKKAKLKIQIFNSPARDLSWFKTTSLGLNRLQLLEDELQKIKEYRVKGHLITIQEAVNYQKWKERQK